VVGTCGGGPGLLQPRPFLLSRCTHVHCQGGGGSRKVSGRFSNLHTPSKNPQPLSLIQAYIAYLLRVTFYDLRRYGVLRSRLQI
jgi:hypothetical protein